MAKAKEDTINKETKEEPKNKKVAWIGSVGRRKRAVARVRIWLEKKGKMTVNEKPVEEVFTHRAAKQRYEEPLASVNRLGDFAVSVLVRGGGTESQLEATILGLSNALVSYDESLREALARKKLLTRDPREKERRKYGFAGRARARKQSPKR